jgi:hypothetical protein
MMFTPLDGHFLYQAERTRKQRKQLAEDMLAAELARSIEHARLAIVGATPRLRGAMQHGLEARAGDDSRLERGSRQGQQHPVRD